VLSGDPPYLGNDAVLIYFVLFALLILIYTVLFHGLYHSSKGLR